MADHRFDVRGAPPLVPGSAFAPIEVGPVPLSGVDLVLRHPRYADAAQWREVRLANQRAIQRFWPTTTGPWEDLHTEWAWLQQVADHRAAARVGTGLALVLEVDGRLAGQVNLTGIDATTREAELGVWVDRALTRRPVALAAVCTALDLAFTTLGLETVASPGDTRNRAALALGHHVGMVREATMRGYSHVDGQWRDHHLMTVRRGDRPAEGFLASRLDPVGDRALARVRPGRPLDTWPTSWRGRGDLARHRARQVRDRLRDRTTSGDTGDGPAPHVDVDGQRVSSGLRSHDRAHGIAELYVDGPVSEGAARSAARQVTAHAFDDLGLHRVTALAAPGDALRATAYAAAGLQHEGTLRSRLRPDGTRADLDLWAVLADDPRP